MIDIIQQRHNCSCAECRAKRYAPLRHQQQRIPKSAPRRRVLPIHRGQSLHSVCPATGPACQRSPGSSCASLGQVSKAMSYTGSPSCVSVNVYPVDKSPNVQHAMQFFFEVFTMSIHPHVDVPDGWCPKAFWAEKMSYAIADPVWFAGTVAFAESMKQKTIAGTSKKSEEVMIYSARAIAGLRDRIAANKTKVDDLAILTITSLMSMDVVCREVKSWKAHIDGLDRILALRGGLDSLNSNEYIKHKVIGFQTFWLYKQMSLGTAPEFASYPDHPFSPDLCHSISKMPDELAELALEGCLNIDLIRVMAPILTLYSKFMTEGKKDREDLRRIKCLAYELEELFSINDLTQLELLLIMALLDLSVTLDQERKQHWLLVGCAQIHCSRLLFTGIEYDPVRHDLLVWMGALFVACGEPTLQSARLGQKILSRCDREKRIDRSTILTMCHRIAWDDILTEKLDVRFDFDAASSISSRSSSVTQEYQSACSTRAPEPEPLGICTELALDAIAVANTPGRALVHP